MKSADSRKKPRRRLRPSGARTPVAVGAPPGELVRRHDAPKAMVSAYAFGADDFIEQRVEDLSTLPVLRGQHPITWVDVIGVADVDAIRRVGEIFGLHELALEDVVHVGQRPKVEAYGDHLFIVVTMMTHREGEGLEREQLGLFVGTDFVVTFQERSGDCFEPVRDRLRAGRARVRTAGADYLAYALLDAVVDNYYPLFENVGTQIDQLEEWVYDGQEGSQVVPALSAMRHMLLELRRQVWPMRDAINALMRHESPVIRPDTTTYLRDCHDHLVRLVDLTEGLRESVASLLDVHLALQSQRLNEVMKVLTVISTIFMPLSFLVGLYGMNFDRASPYNMPELGWRFGYPVVVFLMLLTAGSLLWVFRRAGWLGSRPAR